MASRLDDSLNKRRTVDIIEIGLGVIAAVGLVLSVLRPEGSKILSISLGRYDLFYFAFAALIVYVLVMKVTEK